MFTLSAFDWLIVGVYTLMTIIMGFVFSRKIKTADNFFLGDRSTPWWAIGLSTVATYIGALAFLGGPAWAYENGFSIILIHINYPIAVFIVVTVFLPFFYNSGVASIYEYLERRFGPATRSLMSAIFLIGNIAYSGIMLYTTALVLQFITGIDVTSMIIAVAVVALVYTFLGGIIAVIWTDVAQTLILLFGAILTLGVLILKLPSGLPESLQRLQEQGMTDVFNASFDLTLVPTIWTGVIAMSIYHVVVYGVNQMMVQRTLAAKTIGDAKKAYMVLGYSAVFIFGTFFFIGLLLSDYFEARQFEDGNLIILHFIAVAGIPGMMGLVTAAIVAAAMSSLDSSLNSMATVTTVDFYQKYINKSASQAHYLNVTRAFTVGWAIVIVLPALMFIQSEGSVLETLSKIGAFFVGAKAAAYGLGFYSRQVTEKGLFVGIAFGFFSLVYVDTYMNIAWPWYCLIGGVVSSGVALGASIYFSGIQHDVHPLSVSGQKLMFKRENRPETSDGWYQIPGKVDKASYVLLAYFVITVFLLWLFELSI